jgi:hypothetical protein
MDHLALKFSILVETCTVFACSALTLPGESDIQPAHYINPPEIEIVVDSIPHPADKSLQVYFFRQRERTAQLPTIYFCPGIGSTDWLRYRELLVYLVTHGVNVCYSPYNPVIAAVFPTHTYSAMWRGFSEGNRTWKRFIDNERIGFIGHSYGGGAAPYMAWRAVNIRKWGSKSCFIYTMAPWYCHRMNGRRFNDFPAHTILVTQVFEDDHTNDYRMANDIHQSFPLSESRKCFITVFTGKRDTAIVRASHTVPEIQEGKRDLGRIAVFPVIDSLLYYAFGESFEKQAGRCRGAGHMRIIGGSDGLECRFFKGKTCAFRRSQNDYLNFWGHAMNPRFQAVRCLPPPVRLCVQTPQTIARYCAFFTSSIASPHRD